ncbi:MAG TPA: EAL domain-containing protein [Burkholderiaceae bacterium]|nr:EAL domain-containing protein [Burkholderiaceae bacterium]
MSHEQSPSRETPVRAQNLPIALRLGLALGLLLALLGGVIVFSWRQSEWVGNTSRQLAEVGLHQVTLVRKAQTEALLGAGYLHTLFLLDRQEQRVPVYFLMDQCTAARNEALDALAAGALDPEAAQRMAKITATRQRFMEAFQATVEAVEIDLDSARPLMVEQTLPALRDMLNALDDMATFETQRANARLAEIETLQRLSRNRILGLGVVAVLVALLSAALITRSVARPLAQTARLAREIANGKMDSPLPPAGRDEVGFLVRAIEHMRRSLIEREARIAELAFRDGLTGLANRTLFNERLAQAVASAGRTGHPLSVLLLDLDRFKEVNDALGHHVGDQLLVQVAARISAELARSSDTVARLGGDEFAVLLPTQDASGAQEVARRLLAALEKPLVLSGQNVDLGGSLGIASFPADAAEAAALMARADIAMYVAKHGRSGYARFVPDMEHSSEHALGLLSDLRRAVEENQLTLVFQPKVHIDSGLCQSAEALIRWRHPTRGVVSPAEFIPFAERTGFIRSITVWVLQAALRQLTLWQHEGLSVSLSVNVSTRDLVQQDLPALVRGQLQDAGVAPQRLCLEITEGAIMEDPNRALTALQALHGMGVRLSIDDFGTGYSSLAYLKKLPMDELKIDRSFVRDLDSDPDDAAIVRSTVDLAHNMGLRVVAEGVETSSVLHQLRTIGVDEVQGYYFGQPLAAAEFAAWLRGHREAVAEGAEHCG